LKFSEIEKTLFKSLLFKVVTLVINGYNVLGYSKIIKTTKKLHYSFTTTITALTKPNIEGLLNT